jgi:hypothetical protein
MIPATAPIVFTREMATQFINIYHSTVRFRVLNYYTDEFYEGCMLNTLLFTQIRSMTDIDAYPFVQNVYDAIHVLMSSAYCLGDNIKYCSDNLNIESQSVDYLNKANLNYHVLNKVHSDHYKDISICYEDLNDATLEPNTCSVCQYDNTNKPTESQYLTRFYYSSVFSLNTPVCQDCLLADDIDKDAKSEKNDPDYKPFVFKRDNAVASSSAAAYDLDAELDSYDDDDTTINENIVLTNTYSAMPYDYDAGLHNAQADTEAENDAKRCYELAWQNGWKAAMKYMEGQSRVPHCEYCGKEGKTKKCGGTCNGKVRYCSVECQTADWKQVHKYACLKHTF